LIVAEQSDYPFLLDAYYVQDQKAKPLVIFAHGFKGFKDWGHWDLLARFFAHAGFVFIKFNFSHNGTTLDQPTEFANLDAFGQNNYSKELADLDAVLSWLRSQDQIPAKEINWADTTLIGHSRGGGIGIIKAVEDERIHRLITWAAVSSLSYAWTDEEKVKKWKKEGVQYQLNGRTQQQMPLYYQLYEDFSQQEERLNIRKRLRDLDKPFLIVHGTDDPAVPFFAAHQLQEWSSRAQLQLIDGANHVFGGAHPYTATQLPEHSRLLAKYSLAFLQQD
ncbi:MAG: alpha/beta fold hydrolase, partial [Bacteroidota bacterium]